MNDVGIIGLGVMGSNLALNIAEKQFNVAVFNRTVAKTHEFLEANKHQAFAARLSGYDSLEAFVQSLKVPRKVLILVQAGAATDATITQLRQVLEKGDIVVDTGNAHFLDQGRRAAELEAAGLRFLGMGISGGEEGARKGPAFFPGGTLSVWEEIRPIVEAASAKAEDGRPCVTMNGTGGAGSCVKMYHNAGEYAVLQIWAEVVDTLIAFGFGGDKIVNILSEWKSKGFLTSYMLDITIEVVRALDTDGQRLFDKVTDCVGSKGTGLWSVKEALEVGVPTPGLAAAVIARQMSMYRPERIANATMVKLPSMPTSPAVPEAFVDDLYAATKLAIIASYAQMFQALRALDKVYNFGLNLPRTIATFRAGCILKGYLLQPMTKAFEENPQLPNLLCAFKGDVESDLPRYRRAVAAIVASTNVSIPVFAASLEYINGVFSTTLRYGQIVALQRDVFGRHGFQRLGAEGLHSHQWPELQ